MARRSMGIFPGRSLVDAAGIDDRSLDKLPRHRLHRSTHWLHVVWLGILHHHQRYLEL